CQHHSSWPQLTF
nr:immunoglobulin light chain junction region [Macaca mulatta]